MSRLPNKASTSTSQRLGTWTAVATTPMRHCTMCTGNWQIELNDMRSEFNTLRTSDSASSGFRQKNGSSRATRVASMSAASESDNSTLPRASVAPATTANTTKPMDCTARRRKCHLSPQALSPRSHCCTVLKMITERKPATNRMRPARNISPRMRTKEDQMIPKVDCRCLPVGSAGPNCFPRRCSRTRRLSQSPRVSVVGFFERAVFEAAPLSRKALRRQQSLAKSARLRAGSSAPGRRSQATPLDHRSSSLQSVPEKPRICSGELSVSSAPEAWPVAGLQS
mmetsp:Transcript_61013/g.196564  ORF Transcript_61013/g.196564 Transcript_61013/m.196564 type:complete len:282 (+) Transcript_61013:1385-2230(+)